ncbi:MAG: OPT/YSL family transporter [Calditrichaeota bacterium]|nr:OPT/YSL family transporter [Calditrichota bacterium]
MSTTDPGQPGFTLRAVVIGVALSLFLLMSSTYIALKLGALPWPIIFSVIVSGGLIKALSKTGGANIHEINTAQAGASIGGLIAAGIAFTLPGILYLNQTKGMDIAWPNPWLLGVLTSVAGLLGIMLSVPLKVRFVDEEELPYPAGTAGAELLKLGKTGGRQLMFVMSVGAGAAIFALLRDLYFPAGLAFAALASYGIFLALLPLPLAIAGGYILGHRAGFSWFAGAVIGWLLLVPLLMQNGFEAEAARALAQNLGMGLVLGSGIGFFFNYILPKFKAIFLPIFTARESYLKLFPWLAVLSVGILWLLGVPLFAAVLAVFGVWVTVAVAARMTGETNIDPLEQFGIFIGLVIAFIYKFAALELSPFALFIIVIFVSVACAVAGDAGHDYKSAHLIGTRFFDIVKIDLIAVLFAGLAAPFVFEIVRHAFKDMLFTPAMPAPQAQLVAGSIFGFEFPQVFAAGFAIAFIGEFLNRLLPEHLKGRLLWMPMGIGLFLGFGLAIPIAVGALIRFYIDRRRSHLYQSGLVLAAGMMGGEGIAGFSAGALTIFGLSYQTGGLILLMVFILIFLVSAVASFKKQEGMS